jgi:hypothetical protein
MLGDLAVQLYLEAAERLRSGSSRPINFKGYVQDKA